MARVSVPTRGRTIEGDAEVAAYPAAAGIEREHLPVCLGPAYLPVIA